MYHSSQIGQMFDQYSSNLNEVIDLIDQQWYQHRYDKLVKDSDHLCYRNNVDKYSKHHDELLYHILSKCQTIQSQKKEFDRVKQLIIDSNNQEYIQQVSEITRLEEAYKKVVNHQFIRANYTRTLYPCQCISPTMSVFYRFILVCLLISTYIYREYLQIWAFPLIIFTLVIGLKVISYFTDCQNCYGCKQYNEKNISLCLYTPTRSVNNDICGICHGNMSDSNSNIITKCKHYYHYACLQKWLQRSKECPMCREDLNYTTMYHKVHNMH